jgi:hypothetical protein
VDKQRLGPILTVLALAVAGFLAWKWFTAAKPGVGGPAPEIAGKDLDGKPMKLSDFRGKVVMLDFWGDW